ncbi:MAG TPA: hypothetical protein PLV10_01110, partial [Candidatus Latescibacteria bacterium]|nr:hypothetical protein [Candidatus Latescibacterota bacterium]
MALVTPSFERASRGTFRLPAAISGCESSLHDGTQWRSVSQPAGSTALRFVGAQPALADATLYVPTADGAV